MATNEVVDNFIPLRQGPDDDGMDGKRLEFVRRLWASQDDILRPYHRQIEENVRMLSGQQWHLWSPTFNRYVDVSNFFTDRERAWRQHPVFNRVLPWYILTHARMTENQPILTFRPGPDRIDAELAETMDVVFKTKWREAGMADVWDAICAWVIVGGRGHAISRIDLSLGEVKPWIGQGNVGILGPDGQPLTNADGSPVQRPMQGVPMTLEGQPAIALDPDGNPVPVGEPYSAPEGDITVDPLSPLEVRGEWGPMLWQKKRWHAYRSYLTPERCYEITGEMLEPDTIGADAESVGYLQRVLFGGGWFGATSNPDRLTGERTQMKDGFIEVTCLWQAPLKMPGMEKTEQSPGGRFLMVTKNKVLTDGPRPVAYPYVSPIRTWDFVRIPGRHSGTTPQEAMNAPQRMYNLGWRQILEHRALATNPKALIDLASGIKDGQWTNAPGENILCTMRSGVKAVEYVAPPSLSKDVYDTQMMLREELTDFGSLRGTEGTAPTADPSGELVKELRFNSDRFMGPTMRRAVEEFGRMAEDWRSILPHVWTAEKVLRYAGEDNVARTMTVLPAIFAEGKMDVVADIESMLPEGRGERATKALTNYQLGVFGPPGTPEAVEGYLSVGNFQSLTKFARPGGINRIRAEQENGRLVRGEPANVIPVFEWYDHATDLTVHTNFMCSPEFLKLDPQVQMEFANHRLAHIMMLQAMQAQAMQAAQAQAAAAAPPEQPQSVKLKEGERLVQDPATVSTKQGTDTAKDHAPR